MNYKKIKVCNTHYKIMIDNIFDDNLMDFSAQEYAIRKLQTPKIDGCEIVVGAPCYMCNYILNGYKEGGKDE